MGSRVGPGALDHLGVAALEAGEVQEALEGPHVNVAEDDPIKSKGSNLGD